VSTLTPTLRPLDVKVRDALRRDVGRRAVRVAQLVHGAPAYRCDTCGDEERAGHAPARDPLRWEARPPGRCWRRTTPDGFEPRAYCESGRRRPVLRVTPEQVREIREVLRGLERVGQVRQAGGWWRAAK